MQQQTLFNLPTHIPQPKRDHDGKFTFKCDGKPQDKVRNHLLSGLSITVQQCIRLTHSTELRRIISRLRKSGMNIKDRWYEVNGKKEYKVYYLAKEVKL